MKPKINKDTCIGCGICPTICPEVFKMNQVGDKAEVMEGVEYQNYQEKIQEAIKSCPVNAISDMQISDML